MNKKLLTIAIVLVILIAGIPITSAEPSGLPKAWEAINALQVLVANIQTQITQLTMKTNNIPIIVTGEAYDGDEIYPPAGYTKYDCDLIIRPAEINQRISNLFERYKGTGYYLADLAETRGVSLS